MSSGGESSITSTLLTIATFSQMLFFPSFFLPIHTSSPKGCVNCSEYMIKLSKESSHHIISSVLMFLFPLISDPKEMFSLASNKVFGL